MPKVAAPSFIPPQLATLADKAPEGDKWLHEIKFDGYRGQVIIHDHKARFLTRRGLDWSKKILSHCRRHGQAIVQVRSY